jgi:catechol 2,3-dioxygenase-like lactoylglutathione lyase family enzyme
VLDHVGFQCADLAGSAAFYDAVLAPLGGTRLMDVKVAIGYGTEHAIFWISELSEGEGFRESHIAFAAGTRVQVDAFFQAAVTTGAEVLHQPRIHEDYHEHYYAAFVRDPDGNNVEAVCHRPD